MPAGLLQQCAHGSPADVAGAEERNIKIMLPLVTSVEEVRAARELLEQCKQELDEAGLPYDKDIALGVMIEAPAAALTVDLLARESDFFSIGTNDLTQYTMAVDRGNAQVAHLHTLFQPAVLRSIRSVITAAKEAGIPVDMCGEAATDPELIPPLMAWGLDEFSVRPPLSAPPVPASITGGRMRSNASPRKPWACPLPPAWRVT